MDKVFMLMATFAGAPAEMGIYNTQSACQAAAKDYSIAYCKPVDASRPIYGTCWGCMHGCTAEMNQAICGTDPRSKD